MKRIFFLALFLCSLITFGVLLAHNSIVRAQSANNYLYLNGNVGIGTSNPTSPLHVTGNNQPITVETTAQNAFIGRLGPYFSVNSWTQTYNVDINGNIEKPNGVGWITQYSQSALNISAGTGAVGTPTTTRFTLTTGGNVGIGTTGPGVKLDVIGDIRASSNLYLSAVTPQIISGGSWLQIPSGMYISGGTFYDQTQAEFRGGIHNDSASYLQIAGGTSGHSYFTGNVGILKSAPTYPLDVVGDINFTGTLRQNGTAFGGSQWTTSGSNIYYNTAGGNVGIGTTAPGAKLDVNGGMITRDNVNLLGNYGIALQIRGGGEGNGLLLQSNNGNKTIQSYESQPLYINPLGNNVSFNRDGGNVGIGTVSPGTKLDVNGEIRTNSNLTFTATNPTISAPSYFNAPGGAYFSSGTVYVESPIQVRGGISNDSGSNGGDVNVNENLRVSSSIACIGGYCPPNGAIRLTPNLHLNSNAGNSVILNWDNGTTGNTPTLRIGNGASADAFNVYANGNTYAPIYYDINNSGYYIDPAGISVTNDMRANIFYDQNNTGFYVDPNGTSHFNVINADGAINSSNVGQDVRNGANPSFGTIYASNWFRSQGTNGWYSETYGGGIFMQDTQWVRAYNGKSLWSGATIQADTNMYTPILYDLNDGSYYVDPNGTSRLNNIYAGQYITAHQGSSYELRMGEIYGAAGLYSPSNTTMKFEIQNAGGGWKFTRGNADKVTISHEGTVDIWGTSPWLTVHGGNVCANNISCGSSKTIKENFVNLSANEFLEKLDKVPVMQWNYKKDDASVLHIGPFAEDFYAAFGLNGHDNKNINVSDEAGVALAGVKALLEKDKTLEKKNQDLEKRVSDLEKKLDKLLSK